MIQYELEEDIWSWSEKVKTDVWKVCPVNSVGVMGKGLALEFKNRYKYLEKVYLNAINNGFKAGDIKLVLEDRIILAATKQHWKDRSQLSFIKKICDNLDTFEDIISGEVIMPKLGCGLGGLSQEYVFPILEQYLNNSHVLYYVVGDKKNV